MFVNLIYVVCSVIFYGGVMGLCVFFTLEFENFSVDDVDNFCRYLRDSNFIRVSGLSCSWQGIFSSADINGVSVYSSVVSCLYDAWGFAKLVSGGAMPGSSVNFGISCSPLGAKAGSL